MLKRPFCGLITFAVLCAGLATPAFGQGTMSFGADEVEEDAAPAQKSGPYGKYLDEGKKLYGKKKYDEAALMYYKVTSATEVGAEGYKPEAEYELGKSLLRLQLYQGALNYFGKIVDTGESHPYYVPTLRGLVVLSDAIAGDPSLIQRLAEYTDYYPRDVPEKYRDQFAFLVGRYLYQQMQSKEALRLLTSVTKRSRNYGKARYIAAITHVANYEAKPAVKQFKEVLGYLHAKDDTGNLTADEQELLELTTLGMARVFYSTGDYKTSLKYYSQIDRSSPRWSQALFESSWAYFQTDDYNKALGNLHSLNSPFFADAYFPEGPILAAVIYFYNCKYERVRGVLDDFDYYYAPLKADINAVLADHQDPTAMFKWLENVKKGEVDFDPEVYQILDSAINDAEVRRKFELVDTVRDEKAKLAGMADGWKSSPLGESLVQESELALSFALNDAGSLAQQRLGRVVDDLNELIRQKDEIKFEVARAEQGQIEADIRAGMDVSGNVTKAAQVSAGDEQMYWTFDGEYWRDELGAYVFNINSECSR